MRGEGGIGKTTLLAAAVGQIPPGHTVLHASADAMDRRTHGLLLDAFAPMLDEDRRRTAARQNEHAVGERLLSLIDTVATDPTALVLEDLQWADAASLRLLARLSRTLEQLPLVILGRLAHRPVINAAEVDHLLNILTSATCWSRFELGLLDGATCIAIAKRLTAENRRSAQALHRHSERDPLFVTEMIRALRVDGAFTIARGRGAAGLPARSLAVAGDGDCATSAA